MRKYLRSYLFIVLMGLLHACDTGTRSKPWTPSIVEMISIASLSHDKTLIMMEGNGFQKQLSESQYGQRITTMGFKGSSMDVLLTKSQWRDNDSIFQMVHLDIKPVSACGQLLEELKRSEFMLKEQHQNQERNYWLFAKGVYTVSIYKFKSPLLPLSVELHRL